MTAPRQPNPHLDSCFGSIAPIRFLSLQPFDHRFMLAEISRHPERRDPGAHDAGSRGGAGSRRAQPRRRARVMQREVTESLAADNLGPNADSMIEMRTSN